MVGIILLAVQEVVFLVPLIFLVAVSMLMYTRLKLMVSNDGIRFTGGLKRCSFSWSDITKVDMIRVGKYRTPIAVIYYGNQSLELNRGFYLKMDFNRILTLLETKIAPELFTEQYQNMRCEIG
ncbi:hypothetical protein M2347_003873 [Chryseobacterium sp. H1D6B]|uniref:hypothetical protein n=1 Tax=Chryseobacterium sp. H1D6B TaxID=2940588 RepID=UPI0015C91245|nr:hypothetical protein [Chryseobacterium sp. H1D6B]MDH6254146.1 hypothetical protein [Chryseobacterium sp. H1D6B]